MSRPVVEEMTLPQIEAEIEHLEDYFRMCAENEEGISTKDSVRHRHLVKAKQCHELGLPIEAAWLAVKAGL